MFIKGQDSNSISLFSFSPLWEIFTHQWKRDRYARHSSAQVSGVTSGMPKPFFFPLALQIPQMTTSPYKSQALEMRITPVPARKHSGWVKREKITAAVTEMKQSCVGEHVRR